MSYYIATLVVYFGVYSLGALGLNLQFGLAGIANFGFIVFEAAGAYAAALTSLGSAAVGRSMSETYFWGANLPFPLPFVAAGVAGGLLAAVLGPATMRRMRRDYQAAVMLAISLIAVEIASNDVRIVNGSTGLSGIPSPLGGLVSSMGQSGYSWLYAGFAVVLTVAAYLLCRGLGISPFGRSLRSLRDDEGAAAAVGKDPWRLRMRAFVVGGILGGIAGALLVSYVGAWSPSAWQYSETFVLLQCVILGGMGNERGALLGALLVGILLTQVPSLLPPIGYPGLIDSLQWIAIGVVFILVLWFRPAGLLADRPSLQLAMKHPRYVGRLVPWPQRSATSAGDAGAGTPRQSAR
jgi:branched-chain amino acid transport system permease protein